MGVLLLKIRKADKITMEDLYLELVEKGYTFDQIADMNPHRQYILRRGPKIVKFATTEEFNAWQTANRK